MTNELIHSADCYCDECSGPKTPTQKQSEIYSVILNPRKKNSWAVIDSRGDAEMGNWIIAECIFADHANLISDALNSRAQPSETPVADQVREATEWLNDIDANIRMSFALYPQTDKAHKEADRALQSIKTIIALIDQQAAPETKHFFNGKLYSRRQLEAENKRLRESFADLAAKVESMKENEEESLSIFEYRYKKGVNDTINTVLALIGKAE